MTKHKGEHPRMGATDVCPLIPISDITMEETAAFAKELGERVGKELNIPVYLYEAAQPNKNRNNLSVIRSGEYEGFFKKIKLPEWKPDYGPTEHSVRSGSTVIGARDFLIAYNINLNTTSVRRANSIAFDVRETGRVKREGNPVTGKVIKDAAGNPVYIPGTLKSVKAIGWYIREYGVAQISMNLTNINVTPVHIAFDEVCKKANERGIRVTGSELIGLIPLRCMLDAGRYFLIKQQRSIGVSERELIKIAIKSLGLDELAPFHPEERIIEYLLEDASLSPLVKMNLKDFADETASESPAPGGGSISAYVGALGVSLGTMVANLSAHKPGWDDRWETFSACAEKGQHYKNQLLKMVDEDTNAFNKIMTAFSLPKSTEEEKAERSKMIQEATTYATEVPFKVMDLCYRSMEVIKEMAETGNPNSITDAGVGAICASAAISGAFLNVKINASGLTDNAFARKLITEGNVIQEKAKVLEAAILNTVHSKIPIHVDSKTNS
jgi:glutamate formiminotransferase/formiminotetrahydrofolate cyclodeaminase